MLIEPRQQPEETSQAVPNDHAAKVPVDKLNKLGYTLTTMRTNRDYTLIKYISQQN